MNECRHEWLKPDSGRTTCLVCGRDGWICEDIEAEHIISALRSEIARLHDKYDLQLLVQRNEYMAETLYKIAYDKDVSCLSSNPSRNPAKMAEQFFRINYPRYAPKI